MFTLPGYAVLAHVVPPGPGAAETGFHCAFAVRAPTEDRAFSAVKDHLEQEFGTQVLVQFEASRVLTTGEAPDHALLHPLGERVPLPSTPDAA